VRRWPVPFIALLLPVILAASAAGETRDRQKFTPPCKVYHPSDDFIDWECRPLKKRQTPESLFGDLWRDVLRFNRIDRRHLYPGMRIKVPKNIADIAGFTPMPATYDKAAQEPKYILVDLSEQFLGAYEYGRLALSFPIASGDRKHMTPNGEFRVTAFSRNHSSSLYKIEKTETPYPMRYALRFFINGKDVAFWLHGRDLPGYPASHGCVGLYDEEMQKRHYKEPRKPILDDAKTLFEWVLGSAPDDGGFTPLKGGPKVEVIGTCPR
jgi:hypothetical protein